MTNAIPIFRSLTAKLLAIYLPVILFCTLLLFAAIEIQNYRHAKEELIVSLNRFVESQNIVLAKLLWENDTETLNAAVDQFANNQNLLSAVVYDRAKNVIAETGSSDTLPEVSELRVVRALNYVTAEKIHYVGSLVITFDLEKVRQQTVRRLIEDALTLLMLFGVIVVAIIAVTRVVVGRPLDRLQEAIEQRTADNVRRPVVWDSDDEIGQLVYAFNEMQDHEAAAEAEVELYRKNLENLVETRTAELNQERVRLRTILASMSQGVAAFDGDLKLVAWNEPFVEIRGYPKELVQEGTDYADLIRYDLARGEFDNEGSIPSLEDLLARASDGSPYFAVRRRPDGRHIEVRGDPIPGSGFVSTYADVTERKRAEDELASKQTQLQIALENMPGGMFMVDEKLEIQVINEQYAQIYDIPAELAQVGASLAGMIRARAERGDYGLDDIEILIEKRLLGYADKASLHAQERLPDGRTIELFHKPIADGGAVAVATDITERKQAEDILRLSEQRFRRILENSPIAVGISLDDKSPEDSIIQFANPRFAELIGFEPSEVGTIRTSEFLAGGVDREEPQKRLDAGKSTRNVEMQVSRRDGAFLWVLMSTSPIEYEGRKSALIWLYDISDRKQAEELIEKARDEAEAATRSKSAFLAAMSHEIRTPMNGVVGMIDLLGESDLNMDQRQMMGTVRNSAFSLLQIIDDILDFSKIEAGKLELKEHPLSLRDVVEGVVETLAPIAGAKDVRLSCFIDPALPAWVLGDHVRIRQVLFNVAGNAVKFTDTTTDKQGVVDVLAEPAGDDGEQVTVRFTVRDNGIGMGEDQIEHLFEPFTQAEGSTTRRFGGTGLGLSICRNLIEIMAGKINATSVPGEGSIFSIELPLMHERTKEPPLDEPDLADVPVLLLTSHPDAHRRSETYLDAWNAALHVAGEPAECGKRLRQLAEGGADYIVLLVGSDIDVAVRHSLIDELRGSVGLDNLRFVIMSHEKGEQFGMIETDHVVIRDRPLKRSALIHGIAVAVGRAGHELVQRNEKIGVEDHEVPSVDEARAAGQLILLAEDNPTNQDVIGRQLNRLGYQMEIADDGAVALEMWRQGSYGALLTDCHMPNMDGYGLTGAIRAEQADSGERLPIIAITANALQGEAERCLEAGMDDYLSKPVEMRLLQRMLVKWLPRERSFAADSAMPEVQAVEPAPGNGAPVDPSAIKEMFGDDEIVLEILREFIEPAADNVAEILNAWQTKDAAGVGAAAHKLKSSARTIGANSMADLCAELELAGKNNDPDTIAGRIVELKTMYLEVKEHIMGLA